MKRKAVQKTAATLLIALSATICAALVIHLKAARDIESVLFDIRQLAFAPETAASDEVVIVLLDEQTMKGLPYRTPIPRDFLAQLHEKIAGAGPKLIGYDIFFKDASFEDADRALADAFRESPPYAVVPRREDGTVDMPLPIFADALAGVGLADLPFNPFDATVRTARFEYEKMNSFAAALFKAATGVCAQKSVENKALRPRIGPFATTPFISDDRQTYIRFAGPPGRIGDPSNAFKMYSASLVAKGLVPRQWLADKIVLVGAGYEDLKDAYLTPYYARATGFASMNGVEIHANILSGLLTRQFYFVPAAWEVWIAIFIAALAIAASAVFWPLSRATIVFVAIAVAILVKAVVLFHSLGIVLPVVAPLVGSVSSYGLGLGFRALTEGRQKRFIKNTFARYVPAAVVERMTEHPELLKLGGEERIVTSLFSDIESFTSISERMRPAELVWFLNDYLGRMNEVLFRFGATLDKYEGDAIIAFFNAPLDVAAHELAAARAALGIRRASADVTKDWGDRLGRRIVTRVGLNSGAAVVGNMGSEGRFDYTAIGDTINLASRLEGANKFYGTTILASEATAAGLGNTIVTRPVDRVRVKGKQMPILIYEVMGEEGLVDPYTMERLVMPHREAWRLFEARDFKGARGIVSSILSEFDGGPARELAKRIDRAKREPGWDLVTDLTSK